MRQQSDETPDHLSLREMFGAGTEKALAEAFLRDDFDIDGDLDCAFELADALRQKGPEGWLGSLRNLYNFSRLPAKRPPPAAAAFAATPAPRHSRDRDQKAVSFHYDVSNDFFRVWLDRRMVYSCAYFERIDADLDMAQAAKLRMLCCKLRLRPGQRLLDIGCGWGGLAIFAAQVHGVHVTGVTLSRQQADYASTLVHASGLEKKVDIQLKDYRALPAVESFDAIVSVGMAEHVGAEHLPDYFKTAARLLRPGGVFLNHAIGENVRRPVRVGPSFIEEYVFPDSDIPPVPVVVQAAESAGLEVRDVENLREHYALTLRHWVRRLEAAHAGALHFVSEATYRVWRLYMAGSARGFTRGELGVYQTLLAKPDTEGRTGLPLTRHDWYANLEAGPQSTTRGSSDSNRSSAIAGNADGTGRLETRRASRHEAAPAFGPAGYGDPARQRDGVRPVRLFLVSWVPAQSQSGIVSAMREIVETERRCTSTGAVY